MTEVPTFSECVIGYRSWKLADWVLAPVSYGNPWRPGVNTAKCEAGQGLALQVFMAYMTGQTEQAPKGHAAPHRHCTCGLHAYHDLPDQAEGIVVGAVAAWGALQVHYNGFRAGHAQIVALVAMDGLDEVAELYRVPLVPRNVLALEAQRHGSPLPNALRPKQPKRELDLWQSVQYYSPSPLPASQTWKWQTYTTPIYGSGYTTGGNSALWTPADDGAAEPEDRLARYRKKPANRQGPSRPKRPPKRLGP
jgi:hypothetical protein